MQKYCEPHEFSRIASYLDSQNDRSVPWSLQQTLSSPLAAVYEDKSDLSSAEMNALVQAVKSQSFRYQSLVDNLGIIFRVPINFKALLGSVKNTRNVSLTLADSANVATTGSFIGSQAQAGGSISAGGGNRGSTNYTGPSSISAAASNNQQQQHQQQHAHQSLARSGREQTVSTASVDNNYFQAHRAHHPALTAGGGNRAVPTARRERDSDDDSDDEYEEDEQGGYAVDGGADSRPQSSRNTNFFSVAHDQGAADRLKQALLHEESIWEVPITLPLVQTADNFPNTPYDSMHVQYFAAVRGDWDEAVGLRRLAQGISDDRIAAYIENHFTPTHLAAYLGNYQIIEEFINQGGLNPNLKDSNGDTPLHCASKRGHFRIVQYLVVTCGLSIFEKNENGIIPIVYACKGGYLSIVKFMMEDLPDQRVLASYVDPVFGATLLHWACFGKRVDLLEYLLVKQSLSIGSKSVKDGSTPLLWAAYASNAEVVQYLIEQALADIKVKNKQGWTCLHLAAASGSLEKVLYLIDSVKMKIVDKDKQHRTAFDVATGAAAAYLLDRKKRGFLTGSVTDKGYTEDDF
jgi:ankyrin repeat protein